MSFWKKVRQKINDRKAQDCLLWQQVIAQSDRYVEVLRIEERDLEVLDRGEGGRPPSIFPTLYESVAACGFLTVSVDGEEFVLFCKYVCGAPYGSSWTRCIMAVCASNQGLNTTTGGGTTLISALPDEWHQELIRHLADDGVPEAPSWLPDDIKGRW